MIDYNTSFDQELADLKDTILKMGVLVQGLIYRSVESLKKRDKDLAKYVIKQDVEVDWLELEIDEKCINMIALRQPKAGDLRFITTGMRIVTDLERIGDLAEDVCERTIELDEKPLLKPLIDIPKMAKLAQDSVALAIDAFVNHDVGRTKQIWEKEKEVDRLRDYVHDELEEIMEKDPKMVSRALPLLLVSRHLERICDHATNIAEDVVYMVEGRVVKHGGPLT
ncbi:MAG: phosphate signaling complex protein PhoU [Candidatus Margulisiibacteriota bacterium]|nr:phosphate signaling complex protein PhoU [Candidatus Margulisiibacteriota bacterium]